jgi:hypothetical protein
MPQRYIAAIGSRIKLSEGTGWIEGLVEGIERLADDSVTGFVLRTSFAGLDTGTIRVSILGRQIRLMQELPN